MIKVLIVADIAATFGGNFMQSLSALQQNLPTGGVTYVLPEKAKSCSWVTDLPRVYFTDWSIKSWKEIWKRVERDGGVDVIHNHFIGGRKALNMRLALPSNCHFVWHFHNHLELWKHSSLPKQFAKKVIYRWLYHNSWKIGVSKSVSASVAQISPDHVTTVYNALDFSRLDKNGAAPSIDHQAGTINCMIMGNHFERKGLDMAAKAVARLNEEGHRAMLYVSANEGVYPEINKFLKDKLDLANTESFLRFLTPRNDIGAYYRKMDVFLSPSREEGWTWAIDEAIYCGTMVVVSDIPGQNENKVPGFRWVGDPNTEDISNEMAKQILELYNLPDEEKKKIQLKAIQYMKKYYGMEQWVKNILDVYQMAGQID